MRAAAIRFSALPIQVSPGQSARGSISMVAPSDASVTASITGASHSLRVVSMTATRYVWRNANAKEQQQFIHLPGSATQLQPPKRILVPEVVGTSDGASPLNVPAGATVQVTVEFSAPAGADEGIGSATLNLEGAGWSPVKIPITSVTGLAGTPVDVVPNSIRVSARPGQTVYSGVMIDSAPEAAKVLLTLANPDNIIKVDAVVYFPERRQPTPEELAHMPVRLRAQAEKDGIIQYREVSSNGLGTLFDVPATARLTINVEFDTPAAQPPDYDTNTLIIQATTWQRVEIPLYLAIGEIDAEVVPNAISAAEGDSANVQVTLSSVAGPDTDVSLSVSQAGFGSVVPSVIHVPRHEIVTSIVTVKIAPQAPVGSYPVGLDIRAFDDLQLQTLPFTETISPGAFILTTPTLPVLSLAAYQGARANCPVFVVSGGGYKKLTFTAGTMPPGVTLIAPSWENYGAATTTLQLEFAVDPNALPLDNALASVIWNAGDGVNNGRLDFSFSILQVPQSKSFNQVIVTPSAFGGNVSLTLNSDGTGTFAGEMHAGGIPSYNFTVRAVVRSANGKFAAMAQKSGEVEGSEAGFNPQRSFSWTDPAPWTAPQSAWADIRASTMVVSKSYELAGLLGTLSDILADMLDFVGGIALLNAIPGGAALACLVFVGTELGQLTGIRVVGPGGLVGVATAAGAAFLIGPGMIVPAFIGGVLIGDALVAHRPLWQSEKDLAYKVFRDKVPFDDIIVTNLAGDNSRCFTVPNVDNDILLNVGQGGFDSKLDLYTVGPYTQPGEVFIHELTHAWQIAHSPFAHDYFWKAALAKLVGESAYDYGPAGPAWERFGLEQQASIVNEWYAGTFTKMNPQNKGRKKSDPDDPYYSYISNNIQLGEW
jgi:hypothetical protein